jgi:hypothetical protein
MPQKLQRLETFENWYAHLRTVHTHQNPALI